MTPKQQRFINEYLVDLNATAAAKRAGYKHPNKQGPALLVNLGIRSEIDGRLEKEAEKRGYDTDRIAEQLQCQYDKANDIKDSPGAVQAAITASMGLAKLHGLIIDRSESKVTHVNRKQRLERVSELLDRSGVSRAPNPAGNGASGNGAGKPH